jgi:glycosyltransferase involved in cell wall biosynthesis
MKLSIVVPVYNEEKTLESLYGEINRVSFSTDLEIIFVDDGSGDGSREILKKLASEDPRIRLILKEANSGKGSSLALGFESVTGDIVVVQDADLEYHPGEIPSLIRLILEGKADVVYGSRFSSMSSQVVRFYHYLGNKFLTLLSNLFTNIHLTDMETCYKCFRSEIIRNIVIRSKRFGFEPEITAKIAKLRVNIHEMPISYSQRSYSQGKKIGFWDGIEALWCIVKFNLLTPRSACFREGMPEKYLGKSGIYS